MAENPLLALLQGMLGNSPAVEETALQNQVFSRLVTAGVTVSSGGAIGTTVALTSGTLPIAGITAGTRGAVYGDNSTITLAGDGKISVTTPATGTVTHTAGNLTANALVLGNAVADITVLGSLGSTTTVLHGNAAGAPSFGAVSLTADVSGILPTANGGTGIAFFTAAGPTVARTYTFPDAATTVLTANALVTVAQGGTGLGTLTANGILLGAGTSVPTFLAPGANGNLATSNGTIWTSAPAPAAGALTLLKANSGTSTAAGGTTVDTFAVSGLTAKDRLIIYYTVSSVTQQTADFFLRNTTDTVDFPLANSLAIIAGHSVAGQIVLQQEQQSATDVIGTVTGHNVVTESTFGTTSVGGTISTLFTTAWTGAWTLGLRHSGVTAGGTCRWSYSLFKAAGQ